MWLKKRCIYIILSSLILITLVFGVVSTSAANTEYTGERAGVYFRFYSKSVINAYWDNYQGDLNGTSVYHHDSSGNYLLCLDVGESFSPGYKTVYNEDQAIRNGILTENQLDRIAIGTNWLRNNFPSSKLNGQPLNAVLQIYTWYVRTGYTDWYILSYGWLNPETFADNQAAIAIHNSTLMDYFRQADTHVNNNKNKYTHESKIFVGNGQDTYLLTSIGMSGKLRLIKQPSV